MIAEITTVENSQGFRHCETGLPMVQTTSSWNTWTVFDGYYENINELGCGVKFKEETISILPYADDIALIMPDEQSLQLMLNKLTD